MDETRTVTAIEVNPTDSFQQLVKNQIDGEAEWPRPRTNDQVDIEAQRRQQVHELFNGAELVDLVGHSTPIKCYLKLGDWVLDPSEAERLASYMPASVKSVRLIGCATARNDGRAAVEALTRSGLSAYGTVNKVYTTHFDKKGVKRGIGGPGLRKFLPSGCREPPSPSPVRPAVKASSQPISRTHAPGLDATHPAHPTVPRPLAWLGRCAWPVIAVPLAVLCWLDWLCCRLLATQRVPHRWIWWLLSPWSTAMPGLLTEPLLTYEITSGWKIWTLEILFNFEYARFYSSADSDAKRERVYRIRGSRRVAKALLETYLELAPPGVKLLARHEEAGDRGGRHYA